MNSNLLRYEKEVTAAGARQLNKESDVSPSMGQVKRGVAPSSSSIPNTVRILPRMCDSRSQQQYLVVGLSIFSSCRYNTLPREHLDQHHSQQGRAAVPYPRGYKTKITPIRPGIIAQQNISQGQVQDSGWE